MAIDIRGKGPYEAVAVFPSGKEVLLFKASFYETAVQQAFARSGSVRLNNIPIENPFKKRSRRDRYER